MDIDSATRCGCLCHRHGSARPHIMPTLNDDLETLMACSKCRWRHYPPEKYEPPLGTADGYPHDPYDPTTDNGG